MTLVVDYNKLLKVKREVLSLNLLLSPFIFPLVRGIAKKES